MFVAPSYGSLAAPVLTSPGSGVSVNAAPVFQWNAVPGADHYSFQVAATNSFSPFLYSVDTQNTRATVDKVLQNKTYYWRVQAVTAAGAKGPWSSVRSFVMAWSQQAQPQSPLQNATITYPNPLLLNWTAVPGADTYELTVARHADLTNPIDNTMPVTTEATAYALPERLTDGTYYWGVTPVDAEGHEGTPSDVFQFTYSWPSLTTAGANSVAPTLTVTDLNPDPNVFDPQLSWTPIDGASYYKVDVSSDSGFSSGSIVCCTDQTVATTMTPTTLLPSSQAYYWRVTPYDAENKAGTPVVWSDGQGDPQTFTITFDTASGIPGLSMRDSSFAQVPWVASDPNATNTPIVGWDDVPGAAYYEVQVSPFTGTKCDWATIDWDVSTITTAWTPLGDQHNVGASPVPLPPSSPIQLSTDLQGLATNGAYCVRVKAHRDTVEGTWSMIGDGSAPSFTFSGYPTGTDVSANGYLPAADYLPIQTGSSDMPVFTWKPIAGYQSYYVVVATDRTFTNIKDYAFTKVPAYAPRAGMLGIRAYPNGTYYWAVLPAENADGTGVSADPGIQANEPSESFTRQVPVTTLSAANVMGLGPVFQWSPVQGALDYHVQISDTSDFSKLSPPDGLDVHVDETSYTAGSTLPANQTIWWRVEAEGEGNNNAVLGLGRSAVGTFSTTLDAPSFSAPTAYANANSGDQIPVWRWNSVDGAASYWIDLICPAGASCGDGGVDTTAVVMYHSTGTTPFQWRVRAEFPTVQFGIAEPLQPVDGPYTAKQNFTPTISAPTGATATATGAHTFSAQWTPKSDVKKYLVEVSTSNATGADGSFSGTLVDQIITETPNAAPTMLALGTPPGLYTNGGTLYWHVAAEDDSGNLGAFTTTGTFALPMKIVVASATNYLAHAQTTTITVTTKDSKGHALSGVNVKVSGDGVTATSKKSVSGKVTFKVKPKRSNGTVTFTATKSGLQTGTLTLPVY